MYTVKIVDNIFYFFYLIIILRIFLTWIPNIDWEQQPIKAIREVTDMYLDIFRRFIPPISGLDFSPIIALIFLQIIQIVVVNIVSSILG
ncbi:MAG TPA: YggT family protein [Candidatus Gastranaerophilaceae bacterium]|nr:YggT family protein [Candidatus Gastranaerophilaceae bacterium]HPT41106.1 YggT family protein [Candidatus Gastranaerophilaceae bacterium]